MQAGMRTAFCICGLLDDSNYSTGLTSSIMRRIGTFVHLDIQQVKHHILNGIGMIGTLNTELLHWHATHLQLCQKNARREKCCGMIRICVTGIEGFSNAQRCVWELDFSRTARDSFKHQGQAPGKMTIVRLECLESRLCIISSLACCLLHPQNYFFIVQARRT